MKIKQFKLFLLLLAISTHANAQMLEFYVGDFMFRWQKTQTSPSRWVALAETKNIESYTNITIPSAVTYQGTTYVVKQLGYHALYGGSNLLNITIPNSVTSMGVESFKGCSSLTSIKIPESVDNITNKGLFYGCCSLNTMIVEEGNPYYDSRNECNAIIKTETNKLIVGCVNTTIPNTVTSIGEYAFSGYTNLTNICVPVCVTSVDDVAFYECNNLKTVTVNSPSLLSEHYNVNSNFGTKFGNQVEKYILGNNANSIGNCAFYRCSNLTSVNIPETVTSIGICSFYGCSSLTSISIPETVTSIGYGAFSGCSKITSVNIPEGLISIENDTFDGCSSLSSVVIPEKTISIGDRAFRRCEIIEDIIIPNSVTNIGEEAFSGCRKLATLTIGKNVQTIASNAFNGCYNVNSVTNLSKTPQSSNGNLPVSCTVHVPVGCKDLYKQSVAWSAYNIVDDIDTSVKVSSISLSATSLEVQLGEEFELSAIVLPIDAENKEVEWTVSNPSVVFPIGGIWFAAGEGTATITATAKDGSGVSASCTVTVVSGDDDIYESLNIVDGTDYQNTITKQYESLTFTKTFSASSVMKWNAFYVPININVEEYAGELDFAQIYAFCATVDTNGDGIVDADDENFLFVRPVKTGCIEANVPYLIRPHEAKTYTINSADNILYKTATGQVEFSTSLDKFTVTGLNEAFTVTAGDNNYYVTAAGQLSYRASGSTTVKANRWIMHRESKAYGNNNGTARAKEYRIVALGEDMDVTTAIDMVTLSDKHNSLNGGVYMLDGRKVNAANKLSGGIYIKNGKKFIVK